MRWANSYARLLKATFQDSFDLFRPACISVRGQHALISCLANAARPFRRQSTKMLGYFGAVPSEQDFAVGFKEHFDSQPMIGNQARGGAGGFKDSSGRRKPISDHALTIDV